jgi:hypothetical protein
MDFFSFLFSKDKKDNMYVFSIFRNTLYYLKDRYKNAHQVQVHCIANVTQKMQRALS